MRSVDLLYSSCLLISCLACSPKSGSTKEHIPVSPVVAILNPGESFSFNQLPLDSLEISLEPPLGQLEQTTYQAPSFIEQNTKVAIQFETPSKTAELPIYLLGSSGRKVCFDGNNHPELGLQDRILESNIWGLEGQVEREVDLCISHFDLEEESYLAWDWEVKNRDRSKIICYPEIVYGWKPWRQASTNQVLPKTIESIKEGMVHYTTQSSGRGSHNLAFDLWITHSDRIAVDNIKAEIMVWEDWSGMRPLGEKRGEVQTPFGEYELWTGWTQDWNYYAFKRKNTRHQGELDIKWLLDYLVDQEYLSNKHTLASIEFGNEVATGKGITLLREYAIEIK